MAVARFGDDLDVVLRLEDEAKPAANELLVVGQNDADHGAAASSGSLARTTYPP